MGSISFFVESHNAGTAILSISASFAGREQPVLRAVESRVRASACKSLAELSGEFPEETRALEALNALLSGRWSFLGARYDKAKGRTLKIALC